MRDLLFLIIVLQTLMLLTLFRRKKVCGGRRRRTKRLHDHIPPKYYGYKGGIASITKCQKCNRTALYEDQHPANPCPRCGTEVYEGLTGKWNGSIWERSNEEK